MKVLLVASNPQVVASVDTALVGASDIELERVPTPKEALRRLDDGAGYDLVVADADTAPTGGMHLSREIKARGQQGREVPPIILLVAREQDGWLSDWSQADAYVRKPADPFDFAELVRRVAVGEAPPALPGIGGDPTPSLLDLPTPEAPMIEAEAEVEAGAKADSSKGGDDGR